MAALSNAEWASLHVDFPNLVRDQTRKTGPATRVYNCIAWSIGETGRWINPASTVDRFRTFYRLCGYQECSADVATIDGYVLGARPKHGARLNLGLWESKCGENIRITHARDGLAGGLSIYGDITLHFRPTVTSPSMAGDLALPPYPLADTDDSPEFLAAGDLVSSVANQLTGNYSTLGSTFDQAWKEWTTSWDKNEDLQACNSSSDYATGPGWDALVNMGPSILPQVVNKLKDPANLFACDLYNVLQTDPAKKVNPDDLPKYLDLNNQTKEIIRLYGSQVTDFNVFTRAWEVEQARVQNSGDSAARTSGWAYERIRDMGSVALPLIMARYSADKDGWWHELLHEIKHGKKSGSHTFDKAALYQEWAHNFQTAPRTLTARNGS